MHHEAMKCVDKAAELLSHGDEDSLRYACLQLRMAIGNLFYDWIPLYEDELPRDIRKSWQPPKIIAALIDCDPDVELDKQNVVLFGENPDGTRGNAVSLGKQTAITKKMFHRDYHRLGFYLYAAIDGSSLDVEKLRNSLKEIIEKLNRFRGDRVMMNLAVKANLKCLECRQEFKRNMEALKQNPRFTCLDPECGAIHEVEFDEEDDSSSFSIKQVSERFECPKCETESFFGTHLLKDGFVLICAECDSRYQFRQVYQIHSIASE